MDKLTRTQRAVAAAGLAFAGWVVSALLMGRSVGISNLALGLFFALVSGGIVFWLVGYKDPEIESGRRS